MKSATVATIKLAEMFTYSLFITYYIYLLYLVLENKRGVDWP